MFKDFLRIHGKIMHSEHYTFKDHSDVRTGIAPGSDQVLFWGNLGCIGDCSQTAPVRIKKWFLVGKNLILN